MTKIGTRLCNVREHATLEAQLDQAREALSEAERRNPLVGHGYIDVNGEPNQGDGEGKEPFYRTDIDASTIRRLEKKLAEAEQRAAQLAVEIMGVDNGLNAAQKERDAAIAALREYMSQFGQALEAHGIPFGPAQVAADSQARAVLNPTPAGEQVVREGYADVPQGSHFEGSATFDVTGEQR